MAKVKQFLLGLTFMAVPLGVALFLMYVVDPRLDYSVRQSDGWGFVLVVSAMVCVCYAVVTGLVALVAAIGVPLLMGISLIWNVFEQKPDATKETKASGALNT